MSGRHFSVPITCSCRAARARVAADLPVAGLFGTLLDRWFFFIAKRGLILRVQDDRIIQTAMGHQTAQDLEV